MFYTNFNMYEGEPVRLYRSPSEIRRDILKIKEQIAQTSSRLNIRSMFSELISEYAYGDPDKWIPELSQMLNDAEDTLEKLNDLREDLEGLETELEDTQWALGM